MAHLHDVIDTDLHFIIDPETRSISHASEEPVRLIQGDHNSEIFTFEVPKYIDGHDTSLCNKVQVHFINISGSDPNLTSPGLYEVPIEDVQALEGSDDKLVFPWLIAHEATEYIGTLNFAVRFMCTTSTTDEEGNNIVVKDYVWNTSPYTGVLISEGIDQEDAIITQYYNTIDAWIQTISTEGELAAEVVADAKNDAVDTINNATSAQVSASKSNIKAYAEEVKAKVAENTKREYLDTTVVSETGASEDLVMSQKAVTDALKDLESVVGVKCANMLSDANERCTKVETDMSSVQTHTLLKTITYDATRPRYEQRCKLELGKAYRIITKVFGSDAFGFKFYFYGHMFCYKYSATEMTADTVMTEDISSEFTPDKFTPFDWDADNDTNVSFDSNPANGFVFRPLKYIKSLSNDTYPDIQFQMYFDSNNGIPTKFSWGGDDYRFYNILSWNPFHSRNIAFNQSLDYGITGKPEDEPECYVEVTEGSTIEVYEINENPSGVTFTVQPNGISAITKTGTSGKKDTYTITLEDGTTTTFEVTNGVGISRILRTGSSDHEDRYTIYLDDGIAFYFYIPNANTVGIRTPASGPVIHAEDVIPFTTHTVKVKARSRNLISYPYPSSSGEVNGITFTDNGDGSIKVVGTTEEGFFASFKLADISSSLEDGKTYRVTGSNALLLAYKNENGTVKYVKQDTITWSKDYEFVQLYLQYQSSNGAIDETVYPIVCLSDEGTDYTPYVDLTTAKLSVCGKNMFDAGKLCKTYANDPTKTWTNINGVYSGIAGVQLNLYGVDSGNPLYCNFEPESQYTLSFDAKADVTEASPTAIKFIFMYSDGTRTVGCAINTTDYAKYTMTSDYGKTVVGLYVTYGYNLTSYLKNIQLEKGATATEYEPYSGDTYAIDSIGLPSSIVYAKSPAMTLFTDKRGVMLDATYNVDQTAAYNKFVAKVEALLNGGA